MPRKGEHMPEEAKEKIRKANLGKKMPEEARAKMIAKLTGRHLSEEHKAKLRAKGYLRRQSEETKTKIREANLGTKNHNWKGNNIKLKCGRCRALRTFPCSKGMWRHHIDGNPLNNSPENIMFVTPKQHLELHGTISKAKASNLGRHTSEETKMKLRLALSGSRNPNFGKPMSEEAKSKLRAKAIGRKMSEETRRKISQSNKGKHFKKFHSTPRSREAGNDCVSSNS